MPRISSPVSSRPEYFDRNPSTQTLAFRSEGVAPHASTQRATYTVPTGNNGFIESVIHDVFRATAAGTGATLAGFTQHTPSGGAGVAIQVARLLAEQNSIGDRDKFALGTNMLILAGDQVEITTVDSSTTGTVSYDLMIKITEFDA